MKKKIFMAAFLCFLLVGNGFAKEQSLVNIGAEAARSLIMASADNSEFVILDIRTEGEFKAGHLASAVMLDFYAGDFKSKLNGLDKGKIYLIYCRSGRRTGATIRLMKKMQFESVYNLTRGIGSWKAKGYPVTR